MFDNLPAIVFAAVIVAWLAFSATFLFKPKTTPEKQAPDRKRAPASIVGIVLQGLSYALVWTVRRPWFTFSYHFPVWGAIIWAVGTIGLAFASVAFTFWAVRTLGKEWSLTARVVEGHRLVRNGPYCWVRHPIYTGMWGMLIATGSVVGHPIIWAISWAVFLFGTSIRVRHEERLLREMFGAEFDDYVRRVPAIVPFVRWAEIDPEPEKH